MLSFSLVVTKYSNSFSSIYTIIKPICLYVCTSVHMCLNHSKAAIPIELNLCINGGDTTGLFPFRCDIQFQYDSYLYDIHHNTVFYTENNIVLVVIVTLYTGRSEYKASLVKTTNNL